MPLRIRSGYWLGTKSTDIQIKHWAKIDPLYSALGVDPSVLDPFRIGSGWGDMDSGQVEQAKSNLFAALAQTPENVGARYRAYRISEVTRRYYAKAKNGKATRKSVLTKPAGRTLSAYFGGDWLAYLAYLGEEPHDREEIVQALPETKLMVGSSERTAAVAAEHGLSPEEVEKMLAAYWDQADHSSPLEQRAQTLRSFWAEFDAIHARQAPGMPSLWGLVHEGHIAVMDHGSADHSADRSSDLLSDQLNADITRLWGTAVLPRWPDRLVSEPFPHHQLAVALGPALTFWHGAALTAWFLCEGPYSRTDMEGLAEYHQRHLEPLAEMGCSVPPALFEELQAAEKGLTDRERTPEHSEEIDVGEGLVITFETDFGPSRKDGFEKLRDIITRYRREWAEAHLQQYVRARWETDLRATGDAYNRLAAQRSKAPTAKQFAPKGASAANLWFGGDLTGVYSVLGIKSPITVTYQQLMPNDVPGLVDATFVALGGQPRPDPAISREDREGYRQQQQEWSYARGLAELVIDYVQRQEATGHPPERKELGRSRFDYQSALLDPDPAEAWVQYSAIVQRVLAGRSETTAADSADPDATAIAPQKEVASGAGVTGTPHSPDQRRRPRPPL